MMLLLLPYTIHIAAVVCGRDVDWCNSASELSLHENDIFELPKVHLSEISMTNVTVENRQVIAMVDTGQPFVVQSVTSGWKATMTWNHKYFRKILNEGDLVSSTFATPLKPKFGVSEHVRNRTYYGAFLNSFQLSETLRKEYEYPKFIPESWFAAAGGNEWLHWGWAPCGAKRHMDLMCTSRISVQVKGSKLWRLYPLLNNSDLHRHRLGSWSQIMKPLAVNLTQGDALVWMPGWEHETEILGDEESVSLSLHFLPTSTLYQRTFATFLNNRVMNCAWENM